MSGLAVTQDGAIYGVTSRSVFRNDPVDRSWRLIDAGITSSTVRALASIRAIAGTAGGGVQRLRLEEP